MRLSAFAGVLAIQAHAAALAKCRRLTLGSLGSTLLSWFRNCLDGCAALEARVLCLAWLQWGGACSQLHAMLYGCTGRFQSDHFGRLCVLLGSKGDAAAAFIRALLVSPDAVLLPDSMLLVAC